MTVKEFLSFFPDFCIQTFDDRKDNKDISLTSCGRPDRYAKEQILDLNNRGAGIYFTPNRFPTGERKVVSCTGVNAWIVECDDLSIEEQWKNLKASPLEPSFVVQSKKSLHAYWLAENGTIANYQQIVKGLIKYFKGDPACKDVSRVFRIPGFKHLKDRSKPFEIGIVSEKPELKYTEEQMLKAFPFQEEQQKSLVLQQIVTDDFWQMLSSLDNRSVLTRLSGQTIVNGEIIEFKKRLPAGEYIYVNGQMCDGWLDEQGMIGSGKQGGPTWIQWLSFYGISKPEIARWAKDYLFEAQRWIKEHEPTKEQKIEKQVEEMKQVLVKKDYKLRYTWGTPELDKSLAIIKRSNFIVSAAKSNSGKTTFAFDMAYKNATLGHKVLFLSLEMDVADIKDDLGRKFAGITIEEEYNYNIPDYKQKAYGKKISEIESIKNLYLQGIRRTGDILWESILKVIGQYDELDLIFIDNLDLISANQGEDDLSRQKRIIKSILNFTSDKQIPVVLIHHYRKASADGKDRGMDEMTGSGKIKDGADRVIKVSRCSKTDASYPEKYETTIHLQKGRGYPEVMKKIYFIRGTFVDIPPAEYKYSEEDIDKQFVKPVNLDEIEF